MKKKINSNLLSDNQIKNLNYNSLRYLNKFLRNNPILAKKTFQSLIKNWFSFDMKDRNTINDSKKEILIS
jgi:hypothetical protein